MPNVRADAEGDVSNTATRGVDVGLAEGRKSKGQWGIVAKYAARMLGERARMLGGMAEVRRRREEQGGWGLDLHQRLRSDLQLQLSFVPYLSFR